MANNRGPERLTKPEEISALSKYLREIKSIQEEHTELGSDVLGMSGRDVGKIPEFTELDRAVQEIPTESRSPQLSDHPVEDIPGMKKDITKVFSRNNEHTATHITNDTALATEIESLTKEIPSVKLSRDVDKLGGLRDVELSRDVVKGNMSSIESLADDFVIGLNVNKKVNLPENTIRLEVSNKPELSTNVVELGSVSEVSLSEQVSKLKVQEDPTLSSEVVKMEEPSEPSLSKQVIELGDIKKPVLSDERLKLETVPEPTLPTGVLKIGDIPSVKLSNIVDNLEGIRDLSEEDMYKKVLGLLTEKESTEIENKIASLFSTYLSTSSQTLTVDMVEEYERKLVEYARIRDLVAQKHKEEQEISLVKNREIIPDYKLPEFSSRWNGSDVLGSVKDFITDGDKIDVSSYLRWAVENTIGSLPARGSTRQALIDETLAVLVMGRRALEVATGSNRDKLPANRNENSLNLELEDGELRYSVTKRLLPGHGKDILDAFISGGLDDAARKAYSLGKEAVSKKIKDSGIGKLIGSSQVGKKEPKNRPDPKSPDVIFEKGNDRVNLDEKMQEDLAPNLVNPVQVNFKESYLGGEGIKTTIEELTNGNLNYIDSVDGLIDVLAASPYITTVGKFGSSSRNYNALTLDGNGYWEIVIEPYVGPLNGNFSFLPAFREMDTWNLYQHGVLTYHNKWIPFTGFELQKARMVSKTLGLYDGEIAYPVSSELTNELRISIADDAYKSWRWYFQRCMDASVYSSEIHTANYYSSTPSEKDRNNITVIDKSSQLVAFYKNIAFNIRIYVMTPQYSTIRKFDLLCILREFSEEYVGEIDAAGAPDLSLSFSIVGEVPSASEQPVLDYNTYSTDMKRVIHEGVLSEQQERLDDWITADIKKKLQEGKPGKNGSIICGDLTMVKVEPVAEKRSTSEDKPFERPFITDEERRLAISRFQKEHVNERGPFTEEYGGLKTGK